MYIRKSYKQWKCFKILTFWDLKHNQVKEASDIHCRTESIICLELMGSLFHFKIYNFPVP